MATLTSPACVRCLHVSIRSMLIKGAKLKPFLEAAALKPVRSLSHSERKSDFFFNLCKFKPDKSGGLQARSHACIKKVVICLISAL